MAALMGAVSIASCADGSVADEIKEAEGAQAVEDGQTVDEQAVDDQRVDDRANQAAASQAAVTTLNDFGGDWSGTLEVAGQALPLVLHVDPGGDVPVTLDSTAQGAFGLEANASVEGDTMVAFWPTIGATYTATLSKDRRAISGPFVQNGLALRLRMTRATARVSPPNRPQALVGTPPYDVVTGSAQTGAGLRLAYTATLPAGDGPFPGVVLITGSGPQDRDETILGHKPFAVLADRLTKAGIAVLRFDDRGVGRSGGKFEGATTLDFAGDATAMLQELERLAGERGMRLSRTGLLGHSEGGLVAGLAATELGATPSFIVTLAAPFLPMGEVLVRQTEDTLRLGGASEPQIAVAVATQSRLVEAAMTDAEPADVCAAISGVTKELPARVRSEAQAFCAPWFYAFLRIDPGAVFADVEAPVFALFGALDAQIAPGPNADAARAIPGIDIAVWPGVNHLFQTAKTGAPAEYAQIEETMSEEVIDAVAEWIIDAGGR